MYRALLFAFVIAATPVYAGATAHARLDGLFNALRTAQTQSDAKSIEDQILNNFRESGSASMDLLMQRADVAYGAGDKKNALSLVRAVTSISPDYAEGWHVLAILLEDTGQDQAAIDALRKTIRLNPRHFVAMAQLGDLLQEYGDRDTALKLFRKAMAFDPRFEGMQKRIDALSRKVEGQGI